MRTFRIRISTNKVGSDCTLDVEMDDEDVPEDWESSGSFNREMFEILTDSGLYEWNFEEVT